MRFLLGFFDCAGTPFGPMLFSGLGFVFTADLSAAMNRVCASFSLYSSLGLVGMKLPSDEDKWPDYLPGPKSHLAALGVISLTYGFLEEFFQLLFADVTGMNRDQVTALFQRLPNNNRTKVMRELLEKSTIPANIKELVIHFVKGFEICAENRHGLMHSRSGGIARGISSNDHYGFVFTKNTKSGTPMISLPSLADLRAIADAMNEYAIFGAWVGQAINSARITSMPVDSVWLPPSLKKPALPPSLDWQSEKDFQANQPRPRSFPA
ncbi:MAG: hypothetical protein J0I29_12790 [Rhizobiales bacterium]|nr:hypothetical protein [Hyphomicrobiales bacterium]